MGRRGPKPKSPTLKILQGNAGRRPLGDGTPRGKHGVPRQPMRYANTPAKWIWKSLGKKLHAAGILTLLDGFALELLVDSCLGYRDAMKNDDPVRIEKAAQQLRLMLREFGLTPASRTAVKAAAKEEKKDVDPAQRYCA